MGNSVYGVGMVVLALPALAAWLVIRLAARPAA